MRLDQIAQPVGRDEKIAPPHEAEQCPPCHRKHILPAQPAPDRLELADAFDGWTASVIGGFDPPDAGAERHIGDDAMRSERMKHADLNGAKAATAGKNKRCLWLTSARH